MKAAPVLPTEELVRSASGDFHADGIPDQALKELFSQYPHNDSHAHVLLKVAALNSLYGAGVRAVYDVALHIYRQAPEIDAGLKIGAPDIVDRIAKGHNVRLRKTGKEIHFWCFATKYCCWHNPTSYPIWDARVCRYLRSLKKTEYAKFAHPDAWERYADFQNLMIGFRTQAKLESCTFKEIDEFLWTYGEKPKRTERARSGIQI
jgi:hypothetical protein